MARRKCTALSSARTVSRNRFSPKSRRRQPNSHRFKVRFGTRASSPMSRSCTTTKAAGPLIGRFTLRATIRSTSSRPTTKTSARFHSRWTTSVQTFIWTNNSLSSLHDTILDPNLITALAQWMVNVSGVTPVFGPVPDGIEVNRRVGPGSTVFVLVNFNSEKQLVPLPRPMKSILHQLDSPDEPQLSQPDTAQAEVTQVELSRYGVVILLDQRKP